MKRKHRLEPTATEGMNASQMGRLKMLSCVGEPLFYADWERALFIHYEVDAEALQKWVPYSLDLHEGRAFVSLFRVWHEPWQQVEVAVQIDENTLLARAPGGNEWAREARLVGANYTPGAQNVWMGRPHFVGKN
ncbi:MAG: hypothetical protein GXP30_15130 [Verrucomicrobia bacterium]|nr:hypothetical protein [Verrucomicrobiota bacterium]